MILSFTVFVDPAFDADERETIGNSIVNYVIARTKKGRGVDNKRFKNKNGSSKYTEAYQNHIDFKLGGKIPNPINLTLTGDMLSSIEVLDISLAGRIIIGIDDAQNAEKAQWMREKGYDFLGLSDSEKNVLLRQFNRLTPEEIKAGRISQSIARQFLEDIFDE